MAKNYERNYGMKTMAFLITVCWLSLFEIGSTEVKASLNQSQWLSKIEQSLNANRTWTAQFEQLNPNGSLYHGTFYLSRPGKMRLVYDYPKTQTVIADGKWFIVQDDVNDELTTLALKETPADFFLQENIRFSEQIKVVNFKVDERTIDVTVCRREEPEAGTLTLIFNKSPLELIQWSIVDSHQLQTTISLYKIQRSQKLDPRLFIFSRSDSLPSLRSESK